MTMYEMKASHLLSIMLERPYLTKSGRLSQRTELICRYNFPDNDLDYEGNVSEDIIKIRLPSLNLEKPNQLVVWYDFGDDWRVIVSLEKEIDEPDLTAKELPRVLDGKGFGILEDYGGIYGLMDLADAFKEKGEEYEEYCEEMGVDDFDLSSFDLEDMNFRLKILPAIFAKIYEQHASPSQRAINLIERKYKKKA